MRNAYHKETMNLAARRYFLVQSMPVDSYWNVLNVSNTSGNLWASFTDRWKISWKASHEFCTVTSLLHSFTVRIEFAEIKPFHNRPGRKARCCSCGSSPEALNLRDGQGRDSFGPLEAPNLPVIFEISRLQSSIVDMCFYMCSKVRVGISGEGWSWGNLKK